MDRAAVLSLSVRNLTVSYPDGTEAVSGLDFELRGGESVALIGANGAGKTSLLLALVGILPFSGSIEADGIRLCKKTLADVRRGVGLVFQNPDDQLFMPTIFEDAAFGPRNLGFSEDECAKRAERALRELNVSHLRDRSPMKLSGGEKRAAAIASILSMEPSYLLFDEPTAFLDPRARRNLIGILQKLPQAKLVATHDLHFAAETCGRAILLKEGALFADGSPGELFGDKGVMEGCGVEALCFS